MFEADRGIADFRIVSTLGVISKLSNWNVEFNIGKVGKGKILISGIDLATDLDKRPEAQQLLLSLKKYMAGEKFNPKVEIPLAQINKLQE